MGTLRAGALILALFATGCAGAQQDAAYDPLENVNRFFFSLNQRLERNAGQPAATAYKETVPQGVRGGLHNVLDNMGGPVTVANSLLQLKLESAGIAAGRFLVNTTIGVAGIYDVATDWGMPSRNRDFGETMGTYGVPPGPYLVLPFRGSTDLRDFAGNYLDGYASPLRYVRYEGNNYVGLVKGALGSMDNRSINAARDDIERASVDYYAAVRARFLQRRQELIADKPEPLRTAEAPPG
jgi:phospholipid-binding lipoprotein MlaA